MTKGPLLIAKGADYSANRRGYAGLHTSLTDGLECLFDFWGSRENATWNAAPGKPHGSIQGNPTFDDQFMTVTNAGKFNTGVKPQSGGFTLALVLEGRSGGVASDEVVGAWRNGTTAEGLLQIRHYNNRVTARLNSYAMDEPPFSSPALEDQAFCDVPNAPVFIAVTAEDGVGVKIHNPSAGTIVTDATPGRFFGFDNAPTLLLPRIGTSVAQKVGMLGYWSAPIDGATIANTMYPEFQDQLADGFRETPVAI